jgi:hypothetical protein
MNISWNELQCVQEPGDYTFRDGTITVTFAEIAVWKCNPAAQFQLMRRHPVQQGAFRYVLGRQIDDRFVSAKDQFIYESSNRDTWHLSHDPATGERAVRHRPNQQSGGQESYSDLAEFLAQGANGPEHQALRRLLEANTSLPSILVAYDVHAPRGEAYETLTTAIQSLGAWWHHLETVWIVRTARTPAEIRDQLGQHVGTEDQLLVVDVSGDAAGWIGLNDPGSRWLANIFK